MLFRFKQVQSPGAAPTWLFRYKNRAPTSCDTVMIFVGSAMLARATEAVEDKQDQLHDALGLNRLLENLRKVTIE